jgi:hypothetical protein
MNSKHIALAEKHGVKQVLYTSSNTMRIDGKIYSAQMVSDVETLFEQSKGKTLTIYEGRMNYTGKNQNGKMAIGGFITEE